MKQVFVPNATVSREVYLLTAVVQVALVLALWTAFHPVLFPNPWQVLQGLGQLWTRGVLTGELLNSFTTNLQAVAWSTALSLGIAWLTVLPAIRFPAQAISKARFLGLTGLTLPFTLIFPSSLRVAILTFSMTTWFVTSMADVVASIPQEKFDHARTLRYSAWRTVWEVVVLGQAAQAFEVLRQTAAIGWALVTLVEVLSQSGGGIGLVLYKANRQFDLMPQVFAILLVILVVGYAQDQALVWLKQVSCPYASLKLERR